MSTIKNIRTQLDATWDTLCRQSWKCAAQKRFDRVFFTPVLEEIDNIESAADELEALCRESLEMAKAIREPEENEEWRNETWQRD